MYTLIKIEIKNLSNCREGFKIRITGGLWPPAASNSTKLTFFPLLILVGVFIVVVSCSFWCYGRKTKSTQWEFDKKNICSGCNKKVAEEVSEAQFTCFKNEKPIDINSTRTPWESECLLVCNDKTVKITDTKYGQLKCTQCSKKSCENISWVLSNEESYLVYLTTLKYVCKTCQNFERIINKGSWECKPENNNIFETKCKLECESKTNEETEEIECTSNDDGNVSWHKNGTSVTVDEIESMTCPGAGKICLIDN